MRVRKRRIREGAFQHLYQNTCRGVLLFYDDMDRLVFYTVYSVNVRKYDVQVLAFALMYDHAHSLVRLKDPFRMGDFVRDYTSSYAMEFNRDCGRSGPLFRCAYGSAPKAGAKKIRTAVSYVNNNSVEKLLFGQAEEDRWNLLAYLDNPHPFSEPIVLKQASRRLRRSLKRVEEFSKSNAWLSYRILRQLFDGLSDKEARQLKDFIILKYYPIDKDELMLLYHDYQTLLTAVNSNTGSEYDIKEDFDSGPHTIYRKMLEVCSQSSFACNPKMLVTIPLSQKKRIAGILQQRTQAELYQIKKLLDF